MNYSSRGPALAEMSPFSRPVSLGNQSSGWRPPTYPMVAGDKDGGWRAPSAPIDVGFDAGSFFSNNKIAIAIGAALLAGGIAYYYR